MCHVHEWKEENSLIPENPQWYPNEEPSAKRDPSILGKNVKNFFKKINSTNKWINNRNVFFRYAIK